MRSGLTVLNFNRFHRNAIVMAKRAQIDRPFWDSLAFVCNYNNMLRVLAIFNCFQSDVQLARMKK
jgi:hypothetical protein